MNNNNRGEKEDIIKREDLLKRLYALLGKRYEVEKKKRETNREWIPYI